MTNLDRTILAHIFNSKTQPTVADLACAAKVDRIAALKACADLWRRGYLEILYSNHQLHFRMTCYGMAMTFLSCVVRDAGKNKFGRCGESAGSEQKKAAASAGADFNAPPLSNEQRPIQFALSSAQGVESGKGAESPISAPQIQSPTVAERAVDNAFVKTPLCHACARAAKYTCPCDRLMCDEHSYDTFGQRAKYGICSYCVEQMSEHYGTQSDGRERFGGMTLVKGGSYGKE